MLDLCTIVPKRLEGQALELFHSYQQYHPDGTMWVLLLDREGEPVIPAGDHLRWIHLRQIIGELGLPSVETLCFRFTASELIALLKPMLLDYLLTEHLLERIIYADSRLRLSQNLYTLTDRMDKEAAVISYFSAKGNTTQSGIGSTPTFLTALLIGVADHPSGRRFLEKWNVRVGTRMLQYPSTPFAGRGGIDLLLQLSSKLSLLNGSYAVVCEQASTDWERNSEYPYVEPACYGWSQFSNGMFIPDVFRSIYGCVDPEGAQFNNPFDALNMDDFLGWLKTGVHMRTHVPHFLYEIYLMREDVQNVFPDPLGKDKERFLQWGKDFSLIEYGIDPSLFRCPYGSLEWALAPVHAQTIMPNIVHEIYRSRRDLQQAFPDPFDKDLVSLMKWAQYRIPEEYALGADWLSGFAGIESETDDPEAFLKWALSPVQSNLHLPQIIYEIYKIRPDLQAAFPDPLGIDQSRLLQWAQIHFHQYYLVEDHLLERFQLNGSSETFFRHRLYQGSVPGQQREKGVNLIGYTRTENGVGEACRMAARAIQAAQIPFGMVHIPLSGARSEDISWKGLEITKSKYRTNLMYINADSIIGQYNRLGWDFFAGNYNIALWHWELPEFPNIWSKSFDMIDELWAPSRFVQDALSVLSPVPVVRIPHAVHVICPEGIGRVHFKLPEDQFLFLSMYDTWSFQERKNPQAVIEAFCSAFLGEHSNVGLVLKVNNAHSMPDELARLKHSVAGLSNIYLVEQTLRRDEINALINCVDCFVSLHRSEGFGIVLAEAMYLGKPVIGTLWSGNTDFMNMNNSCGIPYQLIELKKDFGPYGKGQKWAEPDIEQAAFFMKKLVNDSVWCKELAARGRDTIRTEFSPQTVGLMIRKRLKRMKQL